MRNAIKNFALAALFLLIPGYCLASAMIEVSNIASSARLSSFCNLALLVTSVISIKQYFWPGAEYKIPFHIFNIAFVILFYIFGLSFLVHHKDYYPGYETLTPAGCIIRFFFSLNLYSFVQWVILFAFVINIIYIIRFREDFYKA
jgi:hypothetical protein